MEQKRALRVISTDKLDRPTVNAIQVQPPAAPAAITPPAAAEPSPSTVAAMAPREPAVAAPAVGLQPSFKPEPSLLSPATVQAAEAPPQQQSAKSDLKDKHVAKKAKRKSKPAVEESDDDGAVGSTAPDARDSETSAEGRSGKSSGKSRRIVERWIERDYDDGAPRRVTVNHGGGLFEGLFGISRGRDDD